mmetsp:Transcript_16623/g.46939  ORF Transcript_16623/g.46939 Transcript_16623/m.46939 type:complete len:210 (+) Transcript_16623:474-1103(+)
MARTLASDPAWFLSPNKTTVRSLPAATETGRRLSLRMQKKRVSLRLSSCTSRCSTCRPYADARRSLPIAAQSPPPCSFTSSPACDVLLVSTCSTPGRWVRSHRLHCAKPCGWEYTRRMSASCTSGRAVRTQWRTLRYQSPVTVGSIASESGPPVRWPSTWCTFPPTEFSVGIMPKSTSLLITAWKTPANVFCGRHSTSALQAPKYSRAA